ncbi:LysR family transcriptional regulator [Pseudomonadota bacterium AL_CKDN230030165-1A_HGKHYDSX7]
MDLDLRTLRIFVKVAELRSFVRAAEALDITQAGASNALKRLEAQLGTALLLRTTRSVSLTLDGEAFYHRCRQVLADLEDATQVLTRARRKPAGLLRLSLPSSFGRTCVVPALGAFQAKYPKVEVDVGITDRQVDLVEEGVDVAVRFGPLQDSSLIARPLRQVRRRLVAAPAYVARQGRPATLDDLASHNCLALTYHETGRPRRWRFRRGGEPVAHAPVGTMRMNDSHALLAAARAGFGIAQIHDYYVQEDLAEGRLVTLLDSIEPSPDELFIVYPKSRHLSPRVRAFVDYLVVALR